MSGTENQVQIGIAHMNRFSDQQLAIQMVENHSAGYTYQLFVCRMAWRYLAFLAILTAVTVILCTLHAIGHPTALPMILLLVGFAVGVFLRDWQFVDSIRRKWPFTEKTTDWEKVEKLADGISIE
jgi:hypothetical protein